MHVLVGSVMHNVFVNVPERQAVRDLREHLQWLTGLPILTIRTAQEDQDGQLRFLPLDSCLTDVLQTGAELTAIIPGARLKPNYAGSDTEQCSTPEHADAAEPVVQGSTSPTSPAESEAATVCEVAPATAHVSQASLTDAGLVESTGAETQMEPTPVTPTVSKAAALDASPEPQVDAPPEPDPHPQPEAAPPEPDPHPQPEAAPPGLPAAVLTLNTTDRRRAARGWRQREQVRQARAEAEIAWQVAAEWQSRVWGTWSWGARPWGAWPPPE